MKFLFWAAVAFVLVLWFLHGKKTSLKAGKVRPSERESSTEAIVQCAYCGVHIPKSEAISNTGGQVFCSEEHRNLPPSA